MTNCEVCGAEISPGDAFCPGCGRYLWDEETTESNRPDPSLPGRISPKHTPPEQARYELAEPPATETEQPLSKAPEQSREPASDSFPLLTPSTLNPADPPPPQQANTTTTSELAGPDAEIHELLTAIEATRAIASDRGLPDLDEHMARIRRGLIQQQISVVVVGEFKRGKSTLINALLQVAVCPVDADVVTAVPTTVCFAPRPRVKTLTRIDETGSPQEREVQLEDLPALVTEEADPANPERERAVEVGLPHRMLRSGLRLVDTPGVGGLDSAHGFLTLGALRHADGVLFVTDAAQELTGPELAFLRRALDQCPRTALVITKTDLYPQWRRIVELDRQHLAEGGLEVPTIPVSSFLRLRAQHDPALNEESGFAELVTFLGRDIVGRCREEGVRSAAGEFEFAAAQLAQQSEAERAVITQPEKRNEVVARLDQAKRQADKLTDPTATWQKMLRDGIQDLHKDVLFDLQSRLRNIRQNVETLVEQSDPLATWTETEMWLRRQVAMATEANRDLQAARASELAGAVAEQFDMQTGAELDFRTEVDPQLLTDVPFASRSTLKMPGGKLAPMMMAARTGVYLPWLGVSVATAILTSGVATIAIAGIAAALGAGIGGKIIKDERTRQRTYRQQQAKSNVARFIDEVAFLMNKQADDALRTTERLLRDGFERRALLLQNSASAAIAAVDRAGQLDPASQHARRRELAEQDQQLGEARALARELRPEAIAGAAGG